MRFHSLSAAGAIAGVGLLATAAPALARRGFFSATRGTTGHWDVSLCVVAICVVVFYLKWKMDRG